MRSRRGSTAPGPIAAVRTVAGWNTKVPSHETSAKAMKLSMIVLMTSWAPKRALSVPGSAPHRPPAAAALASESGRSTGAGHPASAPDVTAAAKPPR